MFALFLKSQFEFYIPIFFSSGIYRWCEADFLLIQRATHPLNFPSDEWVLLLVTGHPWWQKREGLGGWSFLCINEPVDQKRPLDWQWQGSLIRPAENKTQLSPPVLFKQDVYTDFQSTSDTDTCLVHPAAGSYDDSDCGSPDDSYYICWFRWGSCFNLIL